MQIMLVRQGFIGAVTLIFSAPMTPSRLILFYLAMRMSGLRRRSFTLGINVPVCLLALQHLPLFFFSCLALVPGSTPESKRFVMIILQNNKTLSSSCYCYSLSWSTIKIHHHDSACLIHARPKFSEQINIYHHQTLVGCSVDHCSSCLLSVYLSLASFVWNLNQSRTICTGRFITTEEQKDFFGSD